MNNSMMTSKKHFRKKNFDIRMDDTGSKMSDLLSNSFMNQFVERLKQKDIEAHLDKKKSREFKLAKSFADTKGNKLRSKNQWERKAAFLRD